MDNVLLCTKLMRAFTEFDAYIRLLKYNSLAYVSIVLYTIILTVVR